MGNHREQENLVIPFNGASSMRLSDLLDHPNLFDPVTRRFIPELMALESSAESDSWPYARYIRRTYQLLDKAYRGKLDKSGAPYIFHPLAVASDSFRLARLFGFNQKEATTVWIAGALHDYLEDEKDPAKRAKRKTKTHQLFDLHDLDVFNLMFMLSNFDKDAPYFSYVEKIGKREGFSSSSTIKAQIAALIIKLSDSSQNARPDRNEYILREKAHAEQKIKSNDPAIVAQGKEELAEVAQKEIKILMYRMNIGLVTSKLKFLLGDRDGMPIDATMADFLLGPGQIPFCMSEYAEARKRGLGDLALSNLEKRMRKADANHDVIIVKSSGAPEESQLHLFSPVPANQLDLPSKAPAPYAA